MGLVSCGSSEISITAVLWCTSCLIHYISLNCLSSSTFSLANFFGPAFPGPLDHAGDEGEEDQECAGDRCVEQRGAPGAGHPGEQGIGEVGVGGSHWQVADHRAGYIGREIEPDEAAGKIQGVERQHGYQPQPQDCRESVGICQFLEGVDLS